MYLPLRADQRLKQNHKDVFLPAHPQELYLLGERTRTDIEPQDYSPIDYPVSKKLRVRKYVVERKCQRIYTSRHTGERPGVADVFHSGPTKRERKNAGRFYSDMVEIKPDMERGSTHIWFFNAMLKATERILKTKIGELSLPDQGKAEALRTLGLITDGGKFHELSTWIKACRAPPNFRKAWADAQVADHLRSRRIHVLQMEEAAGGGRRVSPSRRWRRHCQRRTGHNTRGG